MESSQFAENKNFFKYIGSNKKKLSVFLIVILVAGYFIYRHFNTTSAVTTYILGKAQKQTLITTVSGTGQVSQDRTVNITPSSSGKLTQVLVKQGTKVKAGQTIAVVDQTANIQSLNQAKASLASAQASYNQTLAGTTNQDIQLSELSLSSAQNALDQANQNLETVTKQQVINVANAKTAMMNAGLAALPATSNIGNGSVTISGTYTGDESGTYNITVYNSGDGQQFEVKGPETTSGKIYKNIPSALGSKGLFLTFSGSIYNTDNWNITIPNTTSSAYTSAYNSYQSALSNQASAILSAQNQITSAENNLKQAKINLDTKKQPPTTQQIESAKASLISAESQLANAQLAFSNNILKAPFDGTVAALNNQVGDQVSASTNVATVITEQSIAIIPLNEIDVAKVSVGNKATMTFQAIDGLSISGKVVQIDQIGTVSQGVVSYNVKVAFDTEDEKVKPGMSVSVSIITKVVTDAITVPNSAVQTQGGGSYVLSVDPAYTQTVAEQNGVMSKTEPKNISVQVGISDDTNTEILSGLNEGDDIVIQKITGTSAKTTTNSATNALRLGGAAGNSTFGGAAVRVQGR
jgi:HlyD family secretion protein